jgi:ribosome maturation factor RimP
MIMARKGKKRSIQVWGCDLEDGTKITNNDDGIVSVIVNGDHSVTVTDIANTSKIVEGAKWVSYVPRQN